MFDKERFRVALGGVAIELEDVTTLEELKRVIGNLIDAIDSGLSEDGEGEEDANDET